jgi:hypothetical protein
MMVPKFDLMAVMIKAFIFCYNKEIDRLYSNTIMLMV